MKTFTTTRLLLRQISQEDLEPLSKLLGDSDVMRSSLQGPVSAEKAEKILRNMIDQREKFGFSTCAVIHRETGEWMGFCGLYWEEDEALPKTDFAYRFLSKYWGQGYATEAVKACLKHLSELFSDLVINAYIEADNPASLRVAEKAGMVFVSDTFYHGLPVRLYQWTNLAPSTYH